MEVEATSKKISGRAFVTKQGASMEARVALPLPGTCSIATSTCSGGEGMR